MSNYTQITNFTVKDGLITGNPSKLVKGVELDGEFSPISTAIASKEDLTNKNANSGYAGLDSNARLDAARMPAHTGDVTSTAGTVALTIANDAVTNAKSADMAESTIKGRAVGAGTGDPTDLTAAQVITLINTADGAGSLHDADLLDGQEGSFYTSASNLSTGIIPSARVTSIDASATVNGVTVGYRDIPRRTSGFARGESLATSSGVTLNTSDMVAGYALSVYNDSGSSITITQGSGVTLRLGGTATTGSRTIAARGLATIWCNSGTEAIISGSGVT
jgi:hypothetical protein